MVGRKGSKAMRCFEFPSSRKKRIVQEDPKSSWVCMSRVGPGGAIVRCLVRK